MIERAFSEEAHLHNIEKNKDFLKEIAKNTYNETDNKSDMYIYFWVFG